MKLDIDRLKGLAEAATPSKWSVSGSYIAPTREESGTTYVENWRSIALVSHDADREFIASANPAAVLELVAEIKRMRSSLLDFNLERDQLKADNEALRNLLLDASEQISTWGSYASEYFQEKHDLAGCVAKFHDAAMNQEQN